MLDMTATAPPSDLPGLVAAPDPGSSGEPVRDGRLKSLGNVLADTEEKLHRGSAVGARVWPTGFEALDVSLSGGLRSGELVLLGGPQGLGKTTMALQMLANAVKGSQPAIYFSFEHDPHNVLERLIAIEAAEAVGPESLTLNTIRQVFEARHSAAHSLAEKFADTPGGVEAVHALERYADRLHVHASSGVHTGMDEIRRAVEQVIEDTGKPPFVLVDYLQKVPAPHSSLGEDERITAVVEQLKDIALSLAVPVVAIVAAEKASLAAGRRMRVHDLRGSSALAYEADIVLILNDKYSVVARHHLVYHLDNAERFRQWVVLTIEKNRGGIDKIELEFLKRFEHGRFDRDGRIVAEQLIEERVFVE
jgi:replicative DNA helicase